MEFSAPEPSPSSPSSRAALEFFSNPSSLRPTLTLVVESKSHHVFLFYLKVKFFGIAERDIVQVQSFERHLQTPQYYFRTFQCVATPFVMTALVWFVVRMYLNDLYISIPDRLLVVAAMAQLLQNIPTEVSKEH